MSWKWVILVKSDWLTQFSALWSYLVSITTTFLEVTTHDSNRENLYKIRVAHFKLFLFFHVCLCVCVGGGVLFVFPYGALCGLEGWEGLFFPYGALCGWVVWVGRVVRFSIWCFVWVAWVGRVVRFSIWCFVWVVWVGRVVCLSIWCFVWVVWVGLCSKCV